MSTLRVDTLQNRSGGDLITAKGMARAWVNFNGTGTVAIRSSLNVSSVTDLGTGNYRVNFSSAFTDTNYCLTGTASEEDLRENVVIIASVTTSNAQMKTRGGGGSIRDSAILTAIVMA